jgi:putative transposase
MMVARRSRAESVTCWWTPKGWCSKPGYIAQGCDGPGRHQDPAGGREGQSFPRLSHVWLDAAYNAQQKGADWVEKVLGWSAEIVRHPRKVAPEEVMKIWAREWAKEGVNVDWKKLLPEDGPRPFLPKRWIVERSLAWICHNRRMSKDYEGMCASGEAFVYAAMARLMVSRLART